MNQANETKRVPTIQATVLRDASERAMGLHLAFSNGATIRLTDQDLNPTIRAEATWHGVKQKLVDAAAISRNAETGRSATPSDKFEAVKAVHVRIMGDSGLWNEPREGGGNVGGLLFKALCRMYADKTPDVLRAWLDKKTDKEKAALRANPKVAAIITTIQAESVKADAIDTDGLLDELDSGEASE